MAKAPAKSLKSKKKPSAAKPITPAATRVRKLRTPFYKSFKLQKRIKGKTVTAPYQILKIALRVLAKNWKVFLGITILYGGLNILLVQSFNAAGDLTGAKNSLDQAVSGNLNQAISASGLFVYLLSASGNATNATAGTYQAILTLIFSLVMIWVLRQAHAGHKVRIRDGFYKGMTPLIPFLLVLVAVALQMLPLAIGASLFSTVTTSGIAASSVEQALWAVLSFAFGVISLYMVSSSLFALYIVTLPDVTPMKALRSARALVKNRRWTVLRRILFLPIALVLLSAVIIIPLILFVTPVAQWSFFAVSMLILPVVHSYLYALYRDLL